MREILFKAKQIDNGEWIEGSLIDLDIDSGYVPDFPYNIFSTQKCAKCGTPIIGKK